MVYVYAGSGSYATAGNYSLQLSGSADSIGEYSDNMLYRTYTDGTTVLNTVEYNDFALKIYKYGFVPFVSAISENELFAGTVTLIPDSNLSSVTSASAMSLGAGVQVTQSVTTPNELISFDGGTVAFTEGESLTFSGGGTGILREQTEGDTASGKLFVVARNGTAIGDGESIVGSITGVATTNGTGIPYT